MATEPKISQTLKNHKGVLIIGGGAAAAYVWYSYRQASKASAASSTTAATDPNAIDPNTGQPYSYDPSQQGGYSAPYGGYGGGWQYQQPPPIVIHWPHGPKHHPHHAPEIHGFFREIPSGKIFEVTGGKRYHVTASTWKSLNTKKHHVPVKNVLSNNPIFALPFGGNV